MADNAIENVKELDQPKKRGNSSWKPREAVQVAPKDDGKFRYRMVKADEYRIATLMQQGWQVCNAVTGERTYKGKNSGAIIDGKPLDTAVGDRDRVMMRLPIEAAKERDEHYEKKALRNVKGIKQHAKTQVQSGALTENKVAIGGLDLTEIKD